MAMKSPGHCGVSTANIQQCYEIVVLIIFGLRTFENHLIMKIIMQAPPKIQLSQWSVLRADLQETISVS